MPGGGSPAGSLGPGGFAAWQAMTESDAMSQMSGGVKSKFGNAQDEFKINLKNPIEEIRDGQLDLNNEVGLLSPLQDYGSAYANTSAGISAVGQFSFTNQIGPMKKCHLSGGRIILDDLGLWDIQCKIWVDWTGLGGVTEWEIRVLRPDGSIFSRSRTRMEDKEIFSSLDVTSVVVPAAGYQVQVYINVLAAGRGVIGGPTLNRLTVKHISRNTNTGDTGQG
ncbi:hypothetical protein [Rhodococcus sp. ARC_M6]|uniref:hypothetical protein n=1 Tax=Rhodococcus sp. ARC_M6 TaxID=2928852 RepID=UPI001FB2BF20|nr:hypothetical protein [Rhodococcus sp. ARC_M6]MCJ0906215.1 hypothetical protein [Rhodococcus sp. ARC_M6]